MANQTIYPYGVGGELPTGYPIVNDTTTGGADKALSAEAGKMLGQEFKAAYKYGGEYQGTTSRTLIATNVQKGNRSIGKGWLKDTTQIARASTDLYEVDGTSLKHYAEANNALAVDGTIADVVSNGMFKAYLPAGYSYWAVVGRTMSASEATSDFFVAYPTEADSDGFCTFDLTDGGTKDITSFKYFAINLKRSDNGTVTDADITTLNGDGGLKIVQESTDTISPDGETAIAIIGVGGIVVKNIISEVDEDPVQVYTKQAVDALIPSAGGSYYRTPTSDEQEQVMTFDNIVANKQRQPGGGISGSAQNNRLCVDQIFDLNDSFNIVKLFVPSGYSGGVTQCKVTTATSNESDYLFHTWGTGLFDVELDPAYRYVTFNFKRDDNGATSATDVAALEAAVYAVVPASSTSSKSIEVVGTDGIVKTIYNDGDGDTVQVASKAYVDAHVPNNPHVRVLAWNVGHFANGTSQNPSINNSNYDEKLKQWKGVLNKSCANILLLSEFDPVFGSHTVSGSSVSESSVDVLFEPLYPYSSVGTKNGYACNAVISKMVLGGGSSVNYTSRGQLMYYRMDTVTINGKTVKLVATHLDWSQNETYAGYRAAQIQQLVNTFKNEPYVIIAGDFNLDASSEWDIFASNGFGMANHGELNDIYTYPATGANELATAIADRPFPDKALDNIIFRGFKASNITLIDEGTLTDHCCIICDLTIL